MVFGRGIVMLLWDCVLELEEGALYVAIHCGFECPVPVIPFEIDSNVLFAFPIAFERIVFRYCPFEV